MTKAKDDNSSTEAKTLRGTIARSQWLTKLAVFIEQALPRLVLPLSIAALFISLAWFGLFRLIPDWPRLILSFAFIFVFLLALFPLARLRWISDEEALSVLERRNGFSHQPLQVQRDHLSNEDSPLAKALWQAHQKRMAERLAGLKVGAPQPDVSSRDPYALRTIPVLMLVVAAAFLQSNSAGSILDAFRFKLIGSAEDDLRIDAWITPPAYTSRAPIFLKAAPDTINRDLEAPSGSILTIRTTGGSASDVVLTTLSGKQEQLLAKGDESDPSLINTAHYETTLTESAALNVGSSNWNVRITPDRVPEITFQEKPKPTVTGALEIAFTAADDWGVTKAYAEITPINAAEGAIALFDAPEFILNFSRQNPRAIKAKSSKDLSQHPLAGKRVSIRLVAEDGAGQKGYSPAQEMILPAKNFNNPLAGSIAEQRQIFSLNVNALQKALDYNEAIGLRADETIPKLTHYLLLQSVRGRMELIRNGEDLYAAADYLWDVALEIEDADLSDAQRRLKDAQQNLADALERGASNEEIAKLTEELREAMNALMQELAQRGQEQMQGQQSQNNQNVLRQRDLENMMKQIENLARSGDREAAQQLMAELQRMLNNLQMAQPRGNQQQQQQSGQPSQAEQQIEKLGEILQKQQKLMDETFALDQRLRQREQQEQMQRDFPDENQQGENPPSPSDEETAEALREALKKLREQQDALGKELSDMQEGLKGMGVEPPEGFGKAEREMKGAGEQLGRGNGERATERQGEALNALRDGAKQMMQQMMQQMQAQQGEQGSEGQRDPLNRDNGQGLREEYNLPDEMDVQRAREILNAIGEKLGRGQLNEVEKQYLERLLGTQ